MFKLTVTNILISKRQFEVFPTKIQTISPSEMHRCVAPKPIVLVGVVVHKFIRKKHNQYIFFYEKKYKISL